MISPGRQHYCVRHLFQTLRTVFLHEERLLWHLSVCNTCWVNLMEGLLLFWHSTEWRESEYILLILPLFSSLIPISYLGTCYQGVLELTDVRCKSQSYFPRSKGSPQAICSLNHTNYDLILALLHVKHNQVQSSNTTDVQYFSLSYLLVPFFQFSWNKVLPLTDGI